MEENVLFLLLHQKQVQDVEHKMRRSICPERLCLPVADGKEDVRCGGVQHGGQAETAVRKGE